eukprot:3912949-Pyramimonas_sp.AAC.1
MNQEDAHGRLRTSKQRVYLRQSHRESKTQRKRLNRNIEGEGGQGEREGQSQVNDTLGCAWMFTMAAAKMLTADLLLGDCFGHEVKNVII